MAKKKNGKAEETPPQDPAAMSPEEEARFAAEEREHLYASAQQIIECSDVLNWFMGPWRKIVAGEERNAKLLYLVATRLFSRPH